MLAWLQSQLIFPGRVTQGRPSSRFTPPPGCELVRLPTELGPRVTALFGPALSADGSPEPAAGSRPTLLYFYGNGMCLADCLDEVQEFRRLGANLLVPDFLGYGLSEGTPSEDGCYATADACYDHLMRREDIDARRIVAAGWSLGGAVAIDLASRRPTAALAVFSTFTTLEEVVTRLMPWMPAAWWLRHRFESERKIARVRCPILVAHSQTDELIPLEMSHRLARAATGNVTFLTLHGMSHNAMFRSPEREAFSILEGLLRLVDSDSDRGVSTAIPR
jgi:pimeloyl-ACP methyl ester carboxylesterase